MKKKVKKVRVKKVERVTIASEDKHTRFIRLAEKRVGNAIKAIALVGHLSNRSSYDYGEGEVAKLSAALNSATQGVVDSFTAKAKAGKSLFKF
jgi:hypothetical protein